MKEERQQIGLGRHFSPDKKEVLKKREEAEAVGNNPDEAERLFLEKFKRVNALGSYEETRKALELLQRAFDREFGSKKKQ